MPHCRCPQTGAQSSRCAPGRIFPKRLPPVSGWYRTRWGPRPHPRRQLPAGPAGHPSCWPAAGPHPLSGSRGIFPAPPSAPAGISTQRRRHPHSSQRWWKRHRRSPAGILGIICLMELQSYV